MSQLEENIDLAENLILNQESEPDTYLSLKEIEMETRIPQESVRQIAKFDLGLTPFKLANVQHLTREDKKKHWERDKTIALHKTFWFRKNLLYRWKYLQIVSTKQ